MLNCSKILAFVFISAFQSTTQGRLGASNILCSVGETEAQGSVLLPIAATEGLQPGSQQPARLAYP